MARAGITYIDVSNAAESLRSDGLEPTVDRVREKLGTGSKSTIAPLLKRWKTGLTEQDMSGIPSDIVESVKSFYELTQNKAKDQIEHAQIKCQDKLDKMQNRIELLIEENKSLKERESLLSSEIETANKETEKLKEELAQKHIAEIKLEAELDKARIQTQEQGRAIKELKSDSKQVREHFEHYQNSISEERANERETHNFNKLTLETRISEQLQQLQVITNELETLKNTHNSNILELTETSSELLRLQNENTVLSDSNETNIKKLNKFKAGEVDLTKTIASLQNLHQTAEKKLVELNTENTSLKEQSSFMRKTIDRLQQKIESLTDEKISLAQEKSVIQGQFIQLQNSI